MIHEAERILKSMAQEVEIFVEEYGEETPLIQVRSFSPAFQPFSSLTQWELSERAMRLGKKQFTRQQSTSSSMPRRDGETRKRTDSQVYSSGDSDDDSLEPMPPTHSQNFIITSKDTSTKNTSKRSSSWNPIVDGAIVLLSGGPEALQAAIARLRAAYLCVKTLHTDLFVEDLVHDEVDATPNEFSKGYLLLMDQLIADNSQTARKEVSINEALQLLEDHGMSFPPGAPGALKIYADELETLTGAALGQFLLAEMARGVGQAFTGATVEEPDKLWAFHKLSSNVAQEFSRKGASSPPSISCNVGWGASEQITPMPGGTERQSPKRREVPSRSPKETEDGLQNGKPRKEQSFSKSQSHSTRANESSQSLGQYSNSVDQHSWRGSLDRSPDTSQAESGSPFFSLTKSSPKVRLYSSAIEESSWSRDSLGTSPFGSLMVGDSAVQDTSIFHDGATPIPMQFQAANSAQLSKNISASSEISGQLHFDEPCDNTLQLLNDGAVERKESKHPSDSQLRFPSRLPSNESTSSPLQASPMVSTKNSPVSPGAEADVETLDNLELSDQQLSNLTISNEEENAEEHFSGSETETSTGDKSDGATAPPRDLHASFLEENGSVADLSDIFDADIDRSLLASSGPHMSCSEHVWEGIHELMDCLKKAENRWGEYLQSAPAASDYVGFLAPQVESAKKARLDRERSYPICCKLVCINNMKEMQAKVQTFSRWKAATGACSRSLSQTGSKAVEAKVRHLSKGLGNLRKAHLWSKGKAWQRWREHDKVDAQRELAASLISRILKHSCRLRLSQRFHQLCLASTLVPFQNDTLQMKARSLRQLARRLQNWETASARTRVHFSFLRWQRQYMRLRQHKIAAMLLGKIIQHKTITGVRVAFNAWATFVQFRRTVSYLQSFSDKLSAAFSLTLSCSNSKSRDPEIKVMEQKQNGKMTT